MSPPHQWNKLYKKHFFSRKHKNNSPLNNLYNIVRQSTCVCSQTIAFMYIHMILNADNLSYIDCLTAKL
jgi:hypothetical protein